MSSWWPVWGLTQVWPVVLLHVGVLLWLAAMTGVTSYFFHPRGLSLHLQNRAVAVSYYTHAAMAWTMVPFSLVALGLFLYISEDTVWLAVTVVDVLVLVLAAFGWLTDIMRAYSRVTNRRVRLWTLALLLPLLWLVLAVVLIPSVLAVVFGILVVIESLVYTPVAHQAILIG